MSTACRAGTLPCPQGASLHPALTTGAAQGHLQSLSRNPSTALRPQKGAKQLRAACPCPAGAASEGQRAESTQDTGLRHCGQLVCHKLQIARAGLIFEQSLPLQGMPVHLSPFESCREENKLVSSPGTYAMLTGSRDEFP